MKAAGGEYPESKATPTGLECREECLCDEDRPELDVSELPLVDEHGQNPRPFHSPRTNAELLEHQMVPQTKGTMVVGSLRRTEKVLDQWRTDGGSFGHTLPMVGTCSSDPVYRDNRSVGTSRSLEFYVPPDR